MNLKDSLKLLKKHQKWRRGAEIQMSDPYELGQAIDRLIKEVEKD